MVPEDLSDVAQRHSTAQHVSGQGVPQPMRMHIGNARPNTRPGQDGSDGSGCLETDNRRTAAEEDGPVLGWGTPLMEIVRQRFTDIGKERKVTSRGVVSLPDGATSTLRSSCHHSVAEATSSVGNGLSRAIEPSAM